MIDISKLRISHKIERGLLRRARGVTPLSGVGAEGGGIATASRCSNNACVSLPLRATLPGAGLIIMRPPCKVNTRVLRRVGSAFECLQRVRSGFLVSASPALRADTLLPESWIQLRELVLSPSMSLPSLWAWCQKWVCSFVRAKTMGRVQCSGLWRGPELVYDSARCPSWNGGSLPLCSSDGLSLVALVMMWRRAGGAGSGGAHVLAGPSCLFYWGKGGATGSDRCKAADPGLLFGVGCSLDDMRIGARRCRVHLGLLTQTRTVGPLANECGIPRTWALAATVSRAPGKVVWDAKDNTF